MSSLSTPKFAHSRQSSQESNASGSSYQLILEHILTYPGTYEIPLRTMYTLNCAPRAQPLTANTSRAPSPTSSSSSSSPVSSSFSYDQHAATAQFTSALMEQISQLPSHPSSLPPAFVTSFVNRTFPVEIEMVDFPQSLTALDYLRDLEMRRRREIANSFKTLNLDQSKVSPEALDELRSWNPKVATWVESLETKLKKTEKLYSLLYISLRRWILINEMCLEPFNKYNCHAMLNTLYPPVVSQQPAAKITIETLKTQREGYFKYIQSVEKRGTGCLETLMKQGRKEGEANGWPAARRALSSYLTLANSMINECWDVNNLRFNTTLPLEPPKTSPVAPAESEPDRRNGRKVDSGISFGLGGLHSKNSSMSSAKSNMTHHTTASTEASIGKGGTALERLAREFRRIRPKQKSVTEILIDSPRTYTMDQENGFSSPPPKSKGVSRLRKMKSLGSLGDYKHNNSSASSLMGFSRSGTPTFDPKEMKRQREIFEQRSPNQSF